MLKRLARMNESWSRALNRRFPRLFAVRNDHLAELRSAVHGELGKPDVARVLEVGGIDRPLIAKGEGYVYTGLDVEERPRCHDIYDEFLVQSIEQPLRDRYHLIFSAHVLEHVPDNDAAFATMSDALEPGGTIHHLVPSKNHFYSIILRIVGPRVQRRLLGALFPPGALEEAGYPTFFHHCSPREMRRLLERSGFEEIHVRCFYRGNGYFRYFTPAYVVVSLLETVFRSLGLTAFAAAMLVSARRPAAKEAGRPVGQAAEA